MCVILVNAGEFGKKQYAFLPATVGGGHPATVMVKSALGTADNAQRLGLPVSNGVIGPVLLLYQTGTDVCVITKESFAKRNGGAVQIKRDLVDWIVTNPQASPTPTPSPTPSNASGAFEESQVSPTASPAISSTPNG